MNKKFNKVKNSKTHMKQINIEVSNNNNNKFKKKKSKLSNRLRIGRTKIIRVLTMINKMA